MVQESVCRGSDIVFRPVQKFSVWVMHIVLIILSRNLEVFPEVEESLWDEIQEITSGINFFEILYVLQEFFSEVTGRRRMVDI